MQNISKSLLNAGFYARTSLFRLHRKFVPRKRDPSVFTTSVSGIPDEAWAVFREEVKTYKKLIDSSYTLRKALEEAIFRHLKRLENLNWLARSVPTSHGKAVPIQIGGKARDALKQMSEKTGHKQNTILLTAMYHHAQKLYDKSLEEEFRPGMRQVRVGTDEIGKPLPLSREKMLAEMSDDYVAIKRTHLLKLHERMTGHAHPTLDDLTELSSSNMIGDLEDQAIPSKSEAV